MTKLKPLGNTVVARILSLIYVACIYFRNFCYHHIRLLVKKNDLTTISVGCIHAGGTGKTPMVKLLCDYFLAQSKTVVVLSRGYKRKSGGTVIVRPGEQRPWNEIGDEPAMLKQAQPDLWLGIGSNRSVSLAAIRPSLDSNAVVILDDGFQHRKVHRNQNIVCLPPDPFNDYVMPAGYMREPLSALKRADMLCLIGLHRDTDIMNRSRSRLLSLFPNKPVFILYQVIDHWFNYSTQKKMDKIPFKHPLVVSGIARPFRFLELLHECGITPHTYLSFDDHHIFVPHEIENACNSPVDSILTTEKDVMRLSAINLVNCSNICYLKIKLVFSKSNIEQNFYDFIT